MKKFSKNKNFRRGERGRDKAQMHGATCAACGDRCEVPFKPTGERPIYCSSCFEKEGGAPAKRKDYGSSKEKELRRMFSAQCAECGDRCEVPFRPTGDRPIYCSFCFEGVNNKKGDSKKSNKEGGGVTRADIAMLGDQLISINSKFEKLLTIMEAEKKKKVASKKKSPVAKAKAKKTDKKKSPAKKKKVVPKKKSPVAKAKAKKTDKKKSPAKKKK